MNDTFADRLCATNGRPTGFDYLRIGLAVSIVGWHSIVTSYGAGAQTAVFASHWRALFGLMLPLFFALSGFLVSGSLERTPYLLKFLSLRALRIFPALAAETILSAFVLGPFFTADPIISYITNKGILKYLLNILGIIHYRLPGLFLNNPFPQVVNGQLWTVPFELQCYIILAALALFGVARRPRLVLFSVLGMQVILFAVKVSEAHGHFHVQTAAISGYGLVMAFLSGVVLYVLRARIQHTPTLFVLALFATLAGLSLPLGDYWLSFPAAYVTVYVGLLNPKANALHRLGDLSYGIFLYGFPIQQMIESWGAWTHHWYVNIVLALPITTLVAFISWNTLEKRMLELKRHLRFLAPADQALARLTEWLDLGRTALFERSRRGVFGRRLGPSS